MPIDPRIAMGFQSPKFTDPMEAYGNLMQLQNMQQQNALARSQMEDLERERERNALLNRVYSQSVKPDGTIDYGALRTGVAQAGQGALLPGIITQETEQAEAASKSKKANLDLFLSGLQARRQLLNPSMTAEEYLAWHEGNHKDPIVGPLLQQMGIDPGQSRQQIVARIQKGELPNLIAESALGNEKLYDSIKTVETSEGIEGITPAGQTVFKRGAPPKSAGVTINTGDKAELEGVKLGLKGLYDTRERLSNAPDYWQSLETARSLIPSAEKLMGTGAEPLLEAINFFNNRFGTNIQPGAVRDASQLRSLMFQGVLENLRKLDAQPSQQQQFALQQAMGNIGSDPRALEKIIDFTQRQLEQRVERYNKEASQASKKMDFLYDMNIQMPTRASRPAGAPATPAPPPGFKVRNK